MTQRNWDTVDWTKQDTVIARELGCSKDRARQIRVKLGKPKSPHQWKRTYETGLDKITTFMQTPESDGLTYREIADHLGLTRQHIADWFSDHGMSRKEWLIHPGRVKFIDWRLVDQDIGSIWSIGCNIGSVRLGQGRKRAMIDYADRSGYYARMDNEEYRNIYAAQVEKAEWWQKEHGMSKKGTAHPRTSGSLSFSVKKGSPPVGRIGYINWIPIMEACGKLPHSNNGQMSYIEVPIGDQSANILRQSLYSGLMRQFPKDKFSTRISIDKKHIVVYRKP